MKIFEKYLDKCAKKWKKKIDMQYVIQVFVDWVS